MSIIHHAKNNLMRYLMAFGLCHLAMNVYAHEGHGHTEGHSLLHYLAEPVHLAGLLTVVLGVVLFFRWQKVRVKQKTNRDA